MEELVAAVMVVEDDETLALGLVSALELAGYGVRHFDNGEDALDDVEAEPPDLAILDWMLPGMTGIEVLGRLKQSHPEIPVILLTAKGQEDDRVAGLEAGADDYVTKPFSVRELIARVKARLRALNVEPSAPSDLKLASADRRSEAPHRHEGRRGGATHDARSRRAQLPRRPGRLRREPRGAPREGVGLLAEHEHAHGGQPDPQAPEEARDHARRSAAHPDGARQGLSVRAVSAVVR